MKKIWLNIKLFFFYLMRGFKSADNILTSQDKDESDGSSIEQVKETHNVYKDLLRGEVTQEVRELRHEMYYAERLSHEYGYGGNGRSIKKNNMFCYNGVLEQSDGFEVQIIQENKEDTGILGEQEQRVFTLKLKRDFIPTSKIEEYTTRLVVKRINENKVLLDMYVSQTPRQFDRRSRIFVNDINEIYEGDVRSDIIDFDNLSFTSYNAYGTDDLKEFEYNNIKFETIVKFDGSFVLKFTADIVKDGTDILDEFYDKIADEKNKNHESRGNAIAFETAVEIENNENKYDVESAEQLISEMNNGLL